VIVDRSHFLTFQNVSDCLMAMARNPDTWYVLNEQGTWSATTTVDLNGMDKWWTLDDGTEIWCVRTLHDITWDCVSSRLIVRNGCCIRTSNVSAFNTVWQARTTAKPCLQPRLQMQFSDVKLELAATDVDESVAESVCEEEDGSSLEEEESEEDENEWSELDGDDMDEAEEDDGRREIKIFPEKKTHG
jgi:hypothetical protein